ncbi:ATP-binding protein [[Clostridium] scindens]|uniref:ATP-binding protein n=1 Tax=Clostridium scindens (strain JCM 10418 / VPI 12708) TaxID=29347 RepID=UPI001D05DF05|nr:ATP-binding protein [[Clostridium] scindens]MCB6286254.1 GHKL domain-containing protein [[Clostridium] scindens]MCB6421010.1 GHKL domain-containing protein [[Clostridium] scindens]MCB7192769.1 GHKL domain-containing protein [[Clostridium] scindens]MCB7285953.1 GHKL domain-containing protein [[Clostridium] scindens]MCG4929919.1 GHKL domain-containing protein [[Clostridium] scindens]
MDLSVLMELNFIHFPVELLICETAFLIHKVRKEHFIGRLIGTLIIYFLCSGLWMYLIDTVAGDYIFPYVFLYLGYAVLTIIPVFRCFDIKLMEALFVITGAYATQHMCYAFLRIILYLTRHSLDITGGMRFFTQFVCYVFWAFIIYFTVIRNNRDKDSFRKEYIRMAIFAVILAVTAIGFSVYYSYPAESIPLNKYTCVLCPAYGFVCCLLVLVMEYYVLRENHMKKDQEVMEQLLQIANSQQKSSKEAIDIINVKCHDLKHQIKALERMPDTQNRSAYVKDIQQAISIYDAIFHTGCEPLDYVLREKCLISNEYHVAFSCMADGKLINYMNPVDIYALIGNALDNALECVMNEPEEKRIISLHIRKNGDMVLIHMENHCSIEPQFQNGLPVTNKSDKTVHGFGVRSICYIAQKYDGDVRMKVQNQSFVLDIFLPQR